MPGDDDGRGDMEGGTGDGWFAYSPLAEDGNEHLTPEQREIVREHEQQSSAAPEPIGDVRVLIHEFVPGRVEIRYAGPEDVSSADLLRFAIGELSAVLNRHERRDP